jgi:hypothetical protein
MSQIYTFGVVRDDVGRYLPRIAFDASSAPTDTQADAIIYDHAADLCAYLYGLGVNVTQLDAQPTAAMYRTCQRYILLRLAAQIARLRNQNSQTLADRFDDDAQGILDRLRKLPQDMGQTRPVGVNSPNLLHTNATYPEQIYNASIVSGSRLAINAANDKM